MNPISFDEFKKIDIRVAIIIEAEEIPGSEKLMRLRVDLGNETRQIIAGIKESYPPESLLGRNIVIVANLAPRNLMGYESRGMLLATRDSSGIALLTADRDVPPGSAVT